MTNGRILRFPVARGAGSIGNLVLRQDRNRTGKMMRFGVRPFPALLAAALWLAGKGFGQVAPLTNNAPAPTNAAAGKEQLWNWHMEATYIGDWHSSFPAQYTGAHSLDTHAATAETVDFDLFLGARLWKGAEFHLDWLYWQGFGFNHTLGVEAFPNAEAYKVGTSVGNTAPVRVFLRQTFGLGGEEETVADDALHLGGQQDVSRVTLTVGQISVLDVFDQNSYAGDPTTQFLNWATVGNEAWDYPANSLGYITGFTVELNQPEWAVRYGFFQMPRVANGMAEDPAFLRAWGMVTEFERRFKLNDHPGAVRWEAYLNRADMGSYEEAVDNPTRPADIVDTRQYRLKYGFGLNAEYELAKDVGAFMRLGWNDGKSENWNYVDAQKSASGGLSLNGNLWRRPNDTIGLAGMVNAISGDQQRYFEDGGLGLLAGDGKLSYNLEKSLETYYKLQVWKQVNATADYQFVMNPAYNAARGPVSILSLRLHWDY
jgi:high affinity Mn2+ porin